MSISRLVCVFVLGYCAIPASADITYHTQSRSIGATYEFVRGGQSFVDGTDNSSFTSLFTYAAFTEDVALGGELPIAAVANQSSLLSPNSIAVSGHSAAFTDVGRFVMGDAATVSAISSFQIQFELDRLTEFALTGLLGIAVDTGGPARPSVVAAIQLEGPSGLLGADITLDDATSGAGVYYENLNRSGKLTPGLYTLTALAYSQHDSDWQGASPNLGLGGGSAFSMSLALQPIPSPGSAVLGILGIATLVLRRRRRAIAHSKSARDRQLVHLRSGRKRMPCRLQRRARHVRAFYD